MCIYVSRHVIDHVTQSPTVSCPPFQVHCLTFPPKAIFLQAIFIKNFFKVCFPYSFFTLFFTDVSSQVLNVFSSLGRKILTHLKKFCSNRTLSLKPWSLWPLRHTEVGSPACFSGGRHFLEGGAVSQPSFYTGWDSTRVCGRSK